MAIRSDTEIIGEQLAALRSAFDKSRRNMPFNNIEEAHQILRIGGGDIDFQKIPERIKDELISMSSEFETHDFQALASILHLNAHIDSKAPDDACLLIKILESMPHNSWVKSPTDDAWVRAATLGRYQQMLHDFTLPDDRREAVAAAARRLKARGFNLASGPLGVKNPEQLCKEVTFHIQVRLNRLGLHGSLLRIFSAIEATTTFKYKQFLFGRTYSNFGHPKNSSIPFGFLLNLAVRAPDHPMLSWNAQHDWIEIMLVSVDLTAVVDVEPFVKFWLMNPSPRKAGYLLQELAIYDHLFSIRQWPISLTARILDKILRPYDESLRQQYGWGIDEILMFVKVLEQHANVRPVRLSKNDFIESGLSIESITKILPFVTHHAGEANRNYLSPLDATSADFFLRPLLQGINNTYIVSSSSVVGPACYEAFINVARKVVKGDINKLAGDGTERVVHAIFSERGIHPSFVNAKYIMCAEEGECDIVLETEKYILLIETKAKALTRPAMAGNLGAALFDYGTSVILSQIQAMKHERLLHRHGFIEFENGSKINLKGREITRLSVTLLDHGSLHDKWVFFNVATPLLNAYLTYDPSDKKAEKFGDLNLILDDFREEWLAMQERGNEITNSGFGAVALSVGQLESLLTDCHDIEDFIRKLRLPATYATLNPLLEAHHLSNLFKTS